MNARKSAAYYQADTKSWHPGFAEPVPHCYLIKQLSTYVFPGMPPTFGSLIAPSMGGTQVHDRRPHMATIITPANVTIDPAADGALVAAAFTSHECAYCLSPIVSEQRWEKIYEPSTGNGPRYRRYHADLFADEELSCWEKRVIAEITLSHPIRLGNEQGCPVSREQALAFLNQGGMQPQRTGDFRSAP